MEVSVAGLLATQHPATEDQGSRDSAIQRRTPIPALLRTIVPSKSDDQMEFAVC